MGTRHSLGIDVDKLEEKKKKMQRSQPQELEVRPKYENSCCIIGVRVEHADRSFLQRVIDTSRIGNWSEKK